MDFVRVRKNARMAKTVLPRTTSTTNSTPTHDEIAAQAYQIYLREGCVEGRDMDHWLQAEAELRAHGNGGANGQAHNVADSSASTERTIARPQKTESILPNSVVPPNTPIAQVTRSTTTRQG